MSHKILLVLCIFLFCALGNGVLGLIPSITQIPTDQALKSYINIDLCRQKYLLHLTDAPEIEVPNFQDLSNPIVVMSSVTTFNRGAGEFYITLLVNQVVSAEGTYPINLSLEYPNGTFYDFGPILQQECVYLPSSLTYTPFDDKLKIPRVYPENNKMVFSILVHNIDRAINYHPRDINCGIYYCEIYGSSVWNQFDIFVDIPTFTVPLGVATPITAIFQGNSDYQFSIYPPFNSSFVTPTTVQTQSLTAEMSEYLPNYYSINTETAPLKEFSFIGFSSSLFSYLSDLNSMVFYQDSTKKCSLHWNHYMKDQFTNIYQGFSINNNDIISFGPDSTNYLSYKEPSNFFEKQTSFPSTVGPYTLLTLFGSEMYNPKMNRKISQGFGSFLSERIVQYPMGFYRLNGKRGNFNFSFLVSKYYLGGSNFDIIYTTSTLGLLPGQGSTPDTIAPILVEVNYVPLDNELIHVICKVTDNLSGVVNIYFYDLYDNVITFMTLQNLVSGVSTDGSFEIVVNPLIYSTVAKVMIQDAAGNSDEFYSSDIITLPYPPSWLYSAKILDQIQPLFTNQYKGLISIYQLTLIQFSENNLNLLQPKTIVMSLNFTDSHPLITPYIKFA
ncbi:hypothetical protein CYY_010533, partial [Polysphondylium violaceum]